MKKTLFFLSVIMLVINILFSQERGITRGAIQGELYLTSTWYGIYNPIMPIYYDTLQTAIYRITENGKKLTIQYDADCFANPENIMMPQHILADATTGVVFNKSNYYKNSYPHTSLWISFDFGKNWILKEGNIGTKIYYAANLEGLLYRRDEPKGGYRSNDFGCLWNLLHNLNIPLSHIESLHDKNKHIGIAGSLPYYPYTLFFTDNFYLTFTELLIDPEFVFGQIWGRFPDVYRGGLPGEVYVSSMFPYNNQYNPDVKYKVSFSADTGHTFRHVYESEFLNPNGPYPIFMSDREPGVFYIIRAYEIEDLNPWGWHTKVCIEYYRDYGETLVVTYCHDLHKNYGKSCEAVNDLVSEKCGNNCVLLSWNEPESSLPVEEYWVYRRAESKDKNYELKIKNYEIIEGEYELVGVTTGTTFLDEDLPVGVYEYYVVAHYEMGCVADSSNHVTEIISVEESCESVNDLASEKLDANTIFLTWSEPESSLEVEGYHVFRNSLLQNIMLLTDTVYLDENLPEGNYEYYVVAHYTNGCVADSSNHVRKKIELEVKEVNKLEEVRVWPNPAFSTVTIEANNFNKVEVYNVFGQLLQTAKTQVVDVGYFNAGVYFFKIFDIEGNSVVKKVVVVR